MQGQDSDLHAILKPAIQFRIPVFQRDYLWEEQQSAQFLEDVLRIGRAESGRHHFVGSVVCVDAGKDLPGGFKEWVVIDGQQRLTTLTLLVAALRDHIRATGWVGSDDGPTEGRLINYFLKNEQESGERRYKLILRGYDCSTLKAVVDGHGRKDVPSPHSERILASYEFFCEKLKNADPYAVYRGINRLRIVNVSLDRTKDDAQMVFESMNSTGLSLSQSDLIRNFLLMNLEEQLQSDLYARYWRAMEDTFRGTPWALDNFFRAFISWQTGREVRSEDVYAEFRRYRGKHPGDLEALLSDLKRYSGYYAAFVLGYTDGWPAFRQPLARIRHLAGDPVAILIMRLFDFFDRLKALTDQQFQSCLGMLESYLLRRAVCGLPPNSYARVFANVSRLIREDHVFDSFGVALLNQWYEFPSDRHFKDALTTHNLYGKRVLHFLLENLENRGYKERTPTSTLTIEHILPRTLTPQWRKMLGADAEQSHETWLHRLGNLTLTGYNSEYQNHPFATKRDTPGGYRESSLRLNADVRDKKRWTAAEIKSRGEVLANRALAIWRRVSVSSETLKTIRRLDLNDEAKRRDVRDVHMDAWSGVLFEALRKKLLSDAPLIELPEGRSISYFCPEFLLEVVPRKDHLTLLFGVEFGKVQDMDDMLEDLSQRTFVTHAKHKDESGALMTVWTEQDIARCLPIVRRTLEFVET